MEASRRRSKTFVEESEDDEDGEDVISPGGSLEKAFEDSPEASAPEISMIEMDVLNPSYPQLESLERDLKTTVDRPELFVETGKEIVEEEEVERVVLDVGVAETDVEEMVESGSESGGLVKDLKIPATGSAVVGAGGAGAGGIVGAGSGLVVGLLSGAIIGYMTPANGVGAVIGAIVGGVGGLANGAIAGGSVGSAFGGVSGGTAGKLFQWRRKRRREQALSCGVQDDSAEEVSRKTDSGDGSFRIKPIESAKSDSSRSAGYRTFHKSYRPHLTGRNDSKVDSREGGSGESPFLPSAEARASHVPEKREVSFAYTVPSRVQGQRTVRQNSLLVPAEVENKSSPSRVLFPEPQDDMEVVGGHVPAGYDRMLPISFDGLPDNPGIVNVSAAHASDGGIDVFFNEDS